MIGINNNRGFTLFEILLAIVMIGIIMIGLDHTVGTALSSYSDVQNRMEQLTRTRYAVERMGMFVRKTDYIFFPDASDQEIIQVSERLLDTYDNATRAYLIDGDSYLDADFDADGLVNEGGAASAESKIIFSLDKTDSNNWKLQEVMPDYSTADPLDTLAPRVICENVSAFKSSRISAKVVEIRLTLNDGKNEVDLATRARAGHLE